MADPEDDPRNDPMNDPATIWGEILKFTGPHVPPAAPVSSYKVIGTSGFAQKYGSPDRQATGHWCSPCRGIWFGYLLEVTCPACGNRRG